MHISGNNNISNNYLINKPSQSVDFGKKISVQNQNSTQLPSVSATGMSQVNYNAPVSYTKIRDIEVPNCDSKASLFKLANGQKVIILPKKGPTCVRTSFNVGSFNEPDNIRGISHYIEHNLFNGSKDLAPGEYDKKVKAMGGYSNASTSQFQTQYYMNLQLLDDNSLEEAIRLCALQTQYPTFPEEQLQREKEPVKQEIDIYEKKAECLSNNVMLKNLFNIKSSSTELVTGTKDNINSLNRDTVLDYYNTWYTPDNTTTVITGDVDVEEAIQLVSKYYNKPVNTSKMKNRKYEELKPTDKPIRNDIYQKDNPKAVISMGIPLPANMSQEEIKKLNIALSVLNNSNSSLNKKLYDYNTRADFSVVQVSSDINAPRYIDISMSVDDSNTEEALSVLYQEIINSVNNPVDEKIFNSVIDKTKDYLNEKSSYSEVINDHLVDMARNNDLDYFSDYERVINQFKKEDVNSLLAKYVDLNKVSMCVAHPEKVKQDETVNTGNTSNTNVAFGKKAETLSDLPTDTENLSENAINTSNSVSFGKKVNVTASLQEEKAKTQQYVLQNNALFSVNKSDNNLKPVFQMKMQSDYNPNVTKAEVELMNELLTRGTLYHNKEEFDKLLGENNISMGFNFNQDSIELLAKFPKEKSNEFFALMKEALLTPNFTQAEFDLVKQNVRNSILNSQKSVYDKLNVSMNPNDKYSLPVEEQIKKLDSMTMQDFQNLYYSILNNSQVSSCLTAPKDDDGTLVNSAVNNLSAGMPINRQYIVNKNYTYSLYQPNTQEKIVVDSEEKPQAEIAQRFTYKKTGNISDDTKIAAMAKILGGGMSSRLFKDLRENEKLAYSVSGYSSSEKDIGYVDLYISTSTDPNLTTEASPENINKSLQGFERNIQRLKTELVSDEELASIKTVMKSELLNSLESNEDKSFDVVSNTDTYYGQNYNVEKIKAIDSLTAEDIKAAANFVFANKPITSIIASEYTLNALGLKK